MGFDWSGTKAVKTVRPLTSTMRVARPKAVSAPVMPSMSATQGVGRNLKQNSALVSTTPSKKSY